MAGNFPWQMFLQAQEAKNRNNRQALDDAQGIGQNLGDLGQQVIQVQKEKQQKQAWQQKINEAINNPSLQPQQRAAVPFLTPQNVGQLGPSIFKNPSTPGGAANLGQVTWESASPDEQNLAIAVFNGDVRPGDLGFRERSRIVELANIHGIRQGGSPFQSFAGDVKKGSAQSFATGKLGQNALALNTAMGHLNSAFDAYQQIGNTNQAFLNTPLNKLKKATDDPNVVKLTAALNAVRGEAATVFKGSGATDQEISSWQNSISENATPAQAIGALSEMNELFGSRLSALKYQQQDTQNRPSQRQLLSPHAQTLSKRFGSMGKGSNENTKTIDGKTYIKQNGQWFEQ